MECRSCLVPELRKMSVSSSFLIIEQMSITCVLMFLATDKLIIQRKLIFVFLAPSLYSISFLVSGLLTNNEPYLLIHTYHMPDIAKHFARINSTLYISSFNYHHNVP